jgi:hypothetical protein
MRLDLSPAERLARRFDHLVLKPVKHVVVWQCPICKATARTDTAGMSPCCTGPHPSLDEHELTPMTRLHE